MFKIKNRFLFFIFCVLFCFTSIPSHAAHRVQQTDDTIVIVIDPGHGGENLGTIENGFEEKTMTMITAQAMYDELCLYDNVKVYLTRTEDVELSLKTRAEFAKSVNADFLFSIHYNASVDHNLFGSEVWISAMSPFNAYGYQFGYQQLLTMRDMGLYLRGIKTRLNDSETDYYGIIRESTALSIPAVIIEHCHVDEIRDYPFCDSDEELIAFGRADALSVAKYFGLKSSALGVDYSTESSLPTAKENIVVQSTLLDETPPDVCMIELAEMDDDNGTVTLNVTAADYDSPLLYYDYSYDGGVTYSPLQMWPESDALAGTYKDTFSLTLQIPLGMKPTLVFRAYNLFDAYTTSNEIPMLHTFIYDENTTTEEEIIEATTESVLMEDEKLPGTTTFMPAVSEQVEEAKEEVSFFSFLKLCLVIVSIVFFLLLVTRVIVACSSRSRRRQRRK